MEELNDALRAVLARVRPTPAEQVPLEEALGRVLAADVASEDDVPGFDNSAMDGFAVVAASAPEGARLPVEGESRAGHPWEGTLAGAGAVRISTGAMVPDGADAVVPVEEVAERNGAIEIRAAAHPAAHIRRAGEDVHAGEVVLRRGARLTAPELGVLASVGAARVQCARRPRVAVLSTGDELAAPDEPLAPGGVRNTNAYAVPAQVKEAGADRVLVETVPDDPAATRAALENALDAADVVVVCGGVSVGEHDHVKAALNELGAEEVFWKLAVKPGKPTWFGLHGGKPVFGLPGNPVSAMVIFHVLVRPALLAMTGAELGTARVEATMDEDYAKKPGRLHLVRCRAEARGGGWHVRPTKEQGSHVLTSMLGADALALIETERGDVAAGETVTVELLR